MKKTIAISLAVILALSTLVGCTGQETPNNTPDNSTANQSPPVQNNQTSPSPAPAPASPEQNTPDDPPEVAAVPGHVRLGGLRGPGGMGMVKLLEDSENGQTRNTYDYFYGNSADELTPKFLQGELDIIAVPVNLASILYHNTNGAAKIFAVTTKGVLYIVEKGGETIQTVEDLRGQEMFSVGKGSSHEFTLRYIFERNGLNPETDVEIDWIVEPPAVVAAMSTRDHAIAMLPQPFVSVAQVQVPDFRIALDLTREWEALGTGTSFLGTCWIVRSEFVDNHPGALEIFMEEFAASTDYVNSNLSAGAALVEKYVGINTPIAERALPFCNLVAIYGEEMRHETQSFLEVLFGLAPQAIGGSLPGSDFYHGA